MPASFSGFAWLARAMLWLAGLGVLVLLLASGRTTPLDEALYDLHGHYWRYTPRNDVVIVAIDAKSLDALGQFPWPRSIHARLIDRLTAAGVRGIAMDITMPSPDTAHPQNDQLLAEAMHRNGKVVMPVFAESAALGDPLQEALPVAPIAQNVAAIGHVEVAKDTDEWVRGAYLKAGLGSPYWPSLALALAQLDPGILATTLPGMRNPLNDGASPYQWMRDDFVLLRYAGPAGTFGRLSYADVLDGSAPPSLLKDRWVLIGATAAGLGDILQTPASPMPGVEYQANLFESLRRGLLVTPVNFLGQFVISGAALALPLLLYGAPGLGRGWRFLLAALGSMLLLCLVLLRLYHLWWPPTSCLAIVSAAFVTHGVWMRRRSRVR
ncbi:CHASE2 domain-containing protein [Dyella subtropica]|uniref:CHASE2 domain-containing protein n=1 Tax=Dyella subtropica TaxID=2992127 RepID=UPI002257B092|nr:CHASE2 domain-containing protein [Dyella subtropica]